MSVQNKREAKRKNRHLRIRRRLEGSAERPRLVVFRSHKHIYAQLIDDFKGHTVFAASTLLKDVREKMKYGGDVKAAQTLGVYLAESAKRLGIQNVVFDRAGYQYHGRIKALAEAARSGGLAF